MKIGFVLGALASVVSVCALADGYHHHRDRPQTWYKWRVGDQIAHNGDQAVYCFQFDREGVMNAGNPVNDDLCLSRGAKPITFDWRVGDQIAHNGDQAEYCFELNSLGNALNAGNPVDDACCQSAKPVSFSWHLGDEIAHNGDRTVYCFEFNSLENVMNAGNPVDNSLCDAFDPPRPRDHGYGHRHDDDDRWPKRDDEGRYPPAPASQGPGASSRSTLPAN